MATSRAGAIITGDKELNSKLAGLPLKLQKKLARQATRKSAKNIVLPAAKANAPVDTGLLEESLTVRALKGGRGRVGAIVTTREGMFQGDQFYGGMMEFGTKERQHKSGKSVGRIQPNGFAFLRPALYDNADRVRGEFVTDVKQLISEASQ